MPAIATGAVMMAAGPWKASCAAATGTAMRACSHHDIAVAGRMMDPVPNTVVVRILLGGSGRKAIGSGKKRDACDG